MVTSGHSLAVNTNGVVPLPSNSYFPGATVYFVFCPAVKEGYGSRPSQPRCNVQPEVPSDHVAERTSGGSQTMVNVPLRNPLPVTHWPAPHQTSSSIVKGSVGRAYGPLVQPQRLNFVPVTVPQVLVMKQQSESSVSFAKHVSEPQAQSEHFASQQNSP